MVGVCDVVHVYSKVNHNEQKHRLANYIVASLLQNEMLQDAVCVWIVY